MKTRWIPLLALSGLFLSCGPAELGETCETSGSTDECVDGAICTAGVDATTCLKLCEDQEDCAEGENCNGISGSNLKSCQAESASE